MKHEANLSIIEMPKRDHPIATNLKITEISIPIHHIPTGLNDI